FLCRSTPTLRHAAPTSEQQKGPFLTHPPPSKRSAPFGGPIPAKSGLNGQLRKTENVRELKRPCHIQCDERDVACNPEGHSRYRKAEVCRQEFRRVLQQCRSRRNGVHGRFRPHDQGYKLAVARALKC